MERVSFCCLTYNSERTLEDTLESIAALSDETTIVDSFSNDGTLEIAQRYTDKIYQKEYFTHGSQMNYAINLTSNNWVFCIDSDESLDERLAEDIRKWSSKGFGDYDAFRVERQWFFMNRALHAFYPASSPDLIVRLFDKRFVRFNDAPVDDKAVGYTNRSVLKGRLNHATTGNLHELFRKANEYTSRYVRTNSAAHKRVSVLNLCLNPAAAFFKWYVKKRNFLDGFPGFMLGCYAAFYTFLKYAKLYEDRYCRTLSD